MECLVITKPYDYEKLLKQVVNKMPGESWLAIFYLRPQNLRSLVEELGDQGWLGSSSIRQLFDSLKEGYRGLASDVLQDVARYVKNTNGTVRTMIIEGDVGNLVQVLQGKCDNLYCDDPELLRQLRGGKDK
ncbi:hypothetical protein [Oceanithermus sp.]